jgi:hypothetical protein
MAKPSAANAARKAAAAAAARKTTPPPIDPPTTTTTTPDAATPAPKPKVPGQGSKVTQRMREELRQLMKAADPNADVSVVSTMDVTTLGAALDQARNPDPVSTPADLGPLPPDPIVVPKKTRGSRKPKPAAAAATTPAPIEPAKKKPQAQRKPQPRDPAKQTYTKPTGPLPEAPKAKKTAPKTKPNGDDPPPPVDQKPDSYFAQYDPAGIATRLAGKGFYYSPTGMIVGGLGAAYALQKLAEMGRAQPPAAPPGAPPGGSPPMPPMDMPADQMPPQGGGPPVPFIDDEQSDEDEAYPLDDYRRYLPKQPRR